MGKFAEKLIDAINVEPLSLGFCRSSVTASKPRMLLVLQSTDEDIAAQVDLVKKADALLLSCNKAVTRKSIKAIEAMTSNIPMGLVVSNRNQRDVKALFDFLVISPADLLLAECNVSECGYVLSIPLDFPDSLARTVGDMPIESVFIDIEMGKSLNLETLMFMKRLSSNISKPILLKVPVNIAESELALLWTAGVDAIVVQPGLNGENGFAKLRTTLDGMCLQPKRKRLKPHALVPLVKQERDEACCDDDDGCDDACDSA